jgi:hypothetical protein
MVPVFRLLLTVMALFGNGLMYNINCMQLVQYLGRG